MDTRSEKQKMLDGDLYNASGEELTREREWVKDLCFDFNNTRPSDATRRSEILRELFGSVGADAEVVAPMYCDYGYNVSVGDAFFANHNTVLLDCAPITFGNNVFIGPNCGFYTAGHPIDAPTRNELLEFALPISVGDDVWFGAGVHVAPGVTIGSNVVIGMGSVVVKDIPDNVIAVGNPCRPVREISPDDRD